MFGRKKKNKNVAPDAADQQAESHAEPSFVVWVRQQVENEPYWFQKIELAPGMVTPGWSDPRTEKLPLFGLPEDLTGLRVLDIGCAEGFFSFEAERTKPSKLLKA